MKKYKVLIVTSANNWGGCLEESVLNGFLNEGWAIDSVSSGGCAATTIDPPPGGFNAGQAMFLSSWLVMLSRIED